MAIILMMEKSDSCKAHNHIIFITCIYYMVIPYRPSWLCNVFNSALMCTLDIIAKWEECI